MFVCINNQSSLEQLKQNLAQFFSTSEIASLTDTLLEVYINSDYADDKEERQKMFFFLNQLKKLKDV
ncbi:MULTISPECIES: hypothetical protein [Flavobacteriaceae]|uniref:hypothetical protein n=1 Tax=Flavobacteriaceae TaxID=49546 RepID=UPI003A93BA8B